jgi:hypothetical protein
MLFWPWHKHTNYFISYDPPYSRGNNTIEIKEWALVSFSSKAQSIKCQIRVSSIRKDKTDIPNSVYLFELEDNKKNFEK